MTTNTEEDEKYFSTTVQIRRIGSHGPFRIRFKPQNGQEGLELFIDALSLDALGAMMNIARRAKD